LEIDKDINDRILVLKTTFPAFQYLQIAFKSVEI